MNNDTYCYPIKINTIKETIPFSGTFTGKIKLNKWSILCNRLSATAGGNQYKNINPK